MGRKQTDQHKKDTDTEDHTEDQMEEDNASDASYEVEAVVDKQVRRTGTYYLVKVLTHYYRINPHAMVVVAGLPFVREHVATSRRTERMPSTGAAVRADKEAADPIQATQGWLSRR